MIDIQYPHGRVQILTSQLADGIRKGVIKKSTHLVSSTNLGYLRIASDMFISTKVMKVHKMSQTGSSSPALNESVYLDWLKMMFCFPNAKYSTWRIYRD